MRERVRLNKVQSCANLPGLLQQVKRVQCALSILSLLCYNMFSSLVLFAEAPPPEPGAGMYFWIMLPVLLIFIWLFMMNPQKKQEERLRKMLDSLEKNDRVMTVGGLIGSVHTIDKEQNEIVLKVDETNNIKIRFHLTAVSTIFSKENNGNK